MSTQRGARQAGSGQRALRLFLTLQHFSIFAAFAVYLLNLRVFICLNAASATPHSLTSADCHLVTSRVLPATEPLKWQPNKLTASVEGAAALAKAMDAVVASLIPPHIANSYRCGSQAAKANISLEFAHESGQSNASNTNNITTGGSSATSTYTALRCWWIWRKVGRAYWPTVAAKNTNKDEQSGFQLCAVVNPL